MQCAKHPNVETNVTCGKCGKPICPKCMVQTPVGMRCKDCAGLKKLPTYQVSTQYILRAIGAGLGTGIVCGVVWWAIDLVLPFYLLRLIIALGAGYAVGEVISLAVNRKRGTVLAAIGGISAAISFAIATGLSIPVFSPANIIYTILMLAAAVYLAVSRLR
jgi:hypothetical protein